MAGFSSRMRGGLLRHDLSIDADDDFFDVHRPSRHLDGFFYDMDQSAAAGDHHGDHGQRIDRVVLEDFCELFGVSRQVIQLRTGDDKFFSFEKILMKTPQGKGRTVSRHQEIAFVEVWSEGRHQPQLNRPLAELR